MEAATGNAARVPCKQDIDELRSGRWSAQAVIGPNARRCCAQNSDPLKVNLAPALHGAKVPGFSDIHTCIVEQKDGPL